jgi:hypothetical protein
MQRLGSGICLPRLNKQVKIMVHKHHRPFAGTITARMTKQIKGEGIVILGI